MNAIAVGLWCLFSGWVLVFCTAVACEEGSQNVVHQADATSGGAGAADDQGAEPAQVALIEPGTRINPDAPPAGTHLVFRSSPKLASGDVNKVRKAIRDAVVTYTTILIVRSEPDPERQGRFRRGQFAVGVGRPDGTEDVVLTKATAEGLGISLGFIEKQVLGGREKELNTVRSPGSSPTMAIVDFRSNYVRVGERVPIVLRYVALVDPATGKVETVHWVLDETPEGLRFSGDSLKLLSPNHKMNWPMDVDGREINALGAPHDGAFAVTKLPEGVELPAPGQLKTAASEKSFSIEASARLEEALRRVLSSKR